MNVIVVYMGEISHCPPAMSLVKAIDALRLPCSFITYKDDCIESMNDTLKNTKIIELGDSNIDGNFFKKFINFIYYREKLWNIIEKIADSETVLWIISNGTLKYFDSRLFKKKYILHLLELNEELYYIESRHMLKMSRSYAHNAYRVVECEYNRAHITKAWWGLKYLPSVLANKPYGIDYTNESLLIKLDSSIRNVLNKNRNKKIILYQGNISKERPLAPFIQAVNELGDEYVFIAMVNGDDPYKGNNTSKYFYIPFVSPPLHLEITRCAYIGVLSYVPIRNSYSILNTVYCAPNKIWEYTMFSVPMISNDIPALKYHYEKYHDGEVVDLNSVCSIKNAIVKIDKNYKSYSENSRAFFQEYDYKKTVKNILDIDE